MDHATPLEMHQNIFFKREDLSETGSVKDRSIRLQIEKAAQNQVSSLVISTSGNAGISAAYYAKQYNLPITIFISPTTNPEKHALLQKTGADIVVRKEPLTESLAFAQDTYAFHLRQSTSDVALEGYHSLAQELIDQVGADQISTETALFFPVSSGTTLAGVYDGLHEAYAQKQIAHMPQMHAVQTPFIFPIAEHFDSNFKRKARSIVDAIVPPLIPPRKAQVIDIIEKTHGSGWVVADENTLHAHQWLLDNGITTSFEGTLALAGYWKAVEHGAQITTPVILLTGTYYKHD